MFLTLPLGLFRGLAVCSLALAGPWIFFAHAGELAAWVQRYEAKLAVDASYLRLNVKARVLLWTQLLVFALVVVMLVQRSYAGASLLTVLLASPRPWLVHRRARRTTQIEAQLDGWLFGLASVMRATPAPGQAIEYSTALVAPPLRDELDTMIKEQRLGVALDQALARMATRIGSRTVQSALGTLRIGQASGGDLPEILERSAATLREMARLEGVVRTKTAESKAQAWLLVVLPFPLIALLDWLDPGYLAPLLRADSGPIVITLAVLLWLASILLARKILDVDL